MFGYSEDTLRPTGLPSTNSTGVSFVYQKTKQQPRNEKNELALKKNVSNLWHIFKAKIAIPARPPVSVKDNPAEGEEEGTNRYAASLSVLSSRLDQLHCKYGREKAETDKEWQHLDGILSCRW